MPFALLLPLHPLNAASAPVALNKCLHSAFFALIERVDAELAVGLHGSEERKPFTLCPLFVEVPGTTERAVGALRLTLLDDALFAVVADALLSQGEAAALRLGEAWFAVEDILVTADAHPLAGVTTYAALREAADAPQTVTLEFDTPTVFRSQKRDVLWPEPRLAWQSWARAWQAFAPVDASLPDEAQLMAWVERVTIARHAVQTEEIRPNGGIQTGFVGTCEYDLRALEGEARRALSALTDLAFYAGTGRKTAMGMGQTRRIP